MQAIGDEARLQALAQSFAALQEEKELILRVSLADSLDELFDDFSAFLHRRWGLDTIGLQLLDEHRGVLRGYKYSGPSLSPEALQLVFSELPLEADASVSAHVALRQQPAYVRTDARTLAVASAADRRVVELLGLSSSLIAPITDRGRTLGVVHLGVSQGAGSLSRAEREQILHFVKTIGTPLRRLRDREQLERERAEQAELLELCRGISNTIDLPAILDLLGREVRRSGLFDGHLVMLRQGEELVTRHIDLPEQFKGVESAYRDFRLSLSARGGEAQAVASGQTVIVDSDRVAAYSADLQQRFERWCIETLVMMPIPAADGVLGVVWAFRQRSGSPDALRLQRLEQRLPLFSHQISNARFYTDLKRQQEEIEAAAQDRQRFLDLVNRISELTDAEQIYDTITRDFLAWLPFEVAGVVMREGEQLELKCLNGTEPAAAVVESWREYYQDRPYLLDAADGATPGCFLANRHMLIPDVLRVLDLPMSDKDRGALALMRTPRTFLFVPIRHRGASVGLMWLITMSEPVDVGEQDMRLVQSLCAIAGTSIANAQTYSTAESQRRDLAATLATLEQTQSQLAAAEAARTAALVKAKEAAEASAEAKSFFVANTSHEIRTPLTAIIGFAETLLESSVDPEVRGAGEVILRNGHHLLSLINDILDFSKIEARRVELEQLPFSPVELAADVASTVGVLAREKHLEFHMDYRLPIPARMVGDANRLRQVLLNLCNNAVKFTAHGSIGVTLEYQPEARALRCEVRDSGIGISEDAIRRLCEPFTQADVSISRRYGGTGLGLAIARHLVELMGGKFSISSTPGQGSCFAFTVPTGAVEEWIESKQELVVRRGTALVQVPVPSLRGRVLLADDGADNRHLIRLLIERTGADVVAVEDGQRAVDQALHRDFDLVLMDVQMPALSGPEALHLLRERGYARPVLALTANVMRDEVDAYLRTGFDGHLAKPVDRTAFYEALSRYLRPAETGQDLEALVEPEAMAALQRRFSASLGEYVLLVRGASAQADWLAVAEAAHKLKGSAGNFGAPALGQLAGELERAAKAAQEGPVPAELEGLVAEFLAELAARRAAS